MKKYFVLLPLLCAGLLTPAAAQDDDIYFVPSKKQKASEEKNETEAARVRTTALYPSGSLAGQAGSLRDVDEYNRRGAASRPVEAADTALWTDEEWADGTYTDRIVRFHAPRAGIYVSSPFYGTYVDLYFDDPFFYDWAWAHGYAWSPLWSYGWGYGWGWGVPWHYPAWGWNWAYRPWYPAWGHHPGHPGWNYGGIAVRPGGNARLNGRPLNRPGNFGRGGTPSGGSRFTGSRSAGNRGFREASGAGSRGAG